MVEFTFQMFSGMLRETFLFRQEFHYCVFDESLTFNELQRLISCEAVVACFKFMLFLEGAWLFLSGIGVLISIVRLASSYIRKFS